MKCSAKAAGYDGMFGVECSLPEGHAGPHNDGDVEWDFVDTKWRNSDSPPMENPQDGGDR